MDGMYPEVRALLGPGQAAEFLQEGFDLDAYRDQVRRANLEEPREQVARVEDRDAGGVPVRIYRPEQAPARASAAIVHLHGGGFVFNDIDVHDALCRRLANRSGLVVMSVAYRRPPEHPFPAAPDDVDTAVRWLRGRAGQVGVDPDRLLLHGDSAGACLAIVAALRHPGRFRALAMVYPFLDASLSSLSWDQVSGEFGREEGAWYWEQYASGPDDLHDPDFSPWQARDLSVLPPTLVLTAEFDPCRDEGEQMAARIAEAGVDVVGSRALGQVHGFYRHFDTYTAAEPALRQVAGFLALHSR